MRLFCGNLSFDLTERELRNAFAAHAAVKQVEICRDKKSGHSKGFGFVDLMMESDAETAIGSLAGTELHGRELRIEVANPIENRRNGRKHGAGGRRSPY